MDEKKLTETDRKIILTYARNDMACSRTAEDLHYYRSTVAYHLKRIREKTGLDPHCSEDLAKLVEMARTMGDEHMTPKCCEGCKLSDSRGNCSSFRTCTKWRAWFSGHWYRIRRAAALTADQKALRQQKLHEEERKTERWGW